MSVSRRRFLQQLAATAACSALPLPAWGSAGGEGAVVKTGLGSLRGMRENGVHVFRGVPCGLPPYEPSRRLLAAQAVGPWSGIAEAVTPGGIPLQPGISAHPVRRQSTPGSGRRHAHRLGTFCRHGRSGLDAF